MTVHVIPHKWNNLLFSFHHSSAKKHEFWVIRMDERHDGRRPDPQTVSANLLSQLVSRVRLLKQCLEIDVVGSRKRALIKSRPFANNGRQGPTPSFRFRTADVSALALVATNLHSHVTAEAASVSMNTAKNVAIQNCGTPYSRTESEHYDVVRAPSGAGEVFSEQGKARIIFNAQRGIKVLAYPSGQIELRSVRIFL
jgi:hypothetical protein